MTTRPKPHLVSIEPDKDCAIASGTVAGRATPRAAPRLVHSATINYRGGPSPEFVALTRNPSLESPTRFEPTVKGDDDVVI
jgi:hypothetical protein